MGNHLMRDHLYTLINFACFIEISTFSISLINGIIYAVSVNLFGIFLWIVIDSIGFQKVLFYDDKKSD